jgi:4'-phosphopantetheinyl transferase EntD
VSVISAILPGAAVALDTFGELEEASLLPEEAAALGSAAEPRRREFMAGRSLARGALADLGFRGVAVLRGADREPLWPDGVVGSITHCKGYCAAVAARASCVAAVGIDAEIDDDLPNGVLRIVARDEERDWIDARRGDGMHWDRLLFSAKESIFKAWFPIARRWLGFADATVSFDADRGRFSARLVAQRLVVNGCETDRVEGRYLLHRGYVFTSVAVEAAAPQP